MTQEFKPWSLRMRICKPQTRIARRFLLIHNAYQADQKLIPPYTIPVLRELSTMQGDKPGFSQRIKDGLLHYWQGSKLLAYETKISSQLVLKLLKGEQLIRREKIQLRRTTSDLLRLVPFAVILVIPFLEFALPILLKFFPNMLPSTFEDSGTQVKYFIPIELILVRKLSRGNRLRLN